MEKAGYGHSVLEVEDGKVWIRQNLHDAKKAEILTDSQRVIKVLSKMASENPDVVSILTEEGEEHFHCIVGPEVSINIRPCGCTFEWWIETEALVEEDEEEGAEEGTEEDEEEGADA